MVENNVAKATIEKIQKLRRKIDIIDNKILRSLANRMDVVKQIRREKEKNGAAIRDKKREREIFRKLQASSTKLGLRKEYIRSMYSLILKESLTLQKKKKF